MKEEKKSDQERFPTRFSPGNIEWKKRKTHGRNRIWNDPKKLLRDCYNYFSWADDNPIKIKDFVRGGQKAGELVDLPTSRPYSVQGLCSFLGIPYQTWLRYENEDNFADFHEVCSHVRSIIEDNQLTGAIAGVYNANIVARLLSLADKKSFAISDLRKSIDELFPEDEEIIQDIKLDQKPGDK